MFITPRILCPKCECQQAPALACKRCGLAFTYPTAITGAIQAEAATIPTLAEAEKTLIQRAMAIADGDALKAANLIGIGKTTIYRKLREIGACA